MKYNRYKVFGFALVSMVAFSACSDSFLDDKKNYDNVNPDVYNYYEGANARVNDVYSWCLPNTGGAIGWQYPSTGSNDAEGMSTEEYSGFGSFVDPQAEMSVSKGNMPDYFYGQLNNIQHSAYGRIRNINDVIAGITGSTLSDDEKNELLGQVYFFRAWCYFRLVQWFGGVPLVTEVQEPEESVYTPRSSAKKCIEFICSDLDKASRMLAKKTMNGGWSSSNFGRITTGTCVALKGRVLQLWCSPLFNRSNDKTRWANAYAEMKAGLDSIKACGYDLYKTSANVNGSDFAGMFSQMGSSEAVFTTQYNSVQSGNGQKNNGWEAQIRPKNTSGKGGKTPSKMLIDLFPMADGKLPATADTYTLLAKSSDVYDEEFPLENRDPRFYRTFAFPGERWAYNGGSSLAQFGAGYPSYNNGKDYELWNYVWYTKADDAGNVENSTCYGADSLLTNKRGVYLRKRSDDLDVNSNALYSFNAIVSNGGFCYSAAPYMELRYAEVLLNLAEVACGAGDMEYAVSLLKLIRERAGYTAENNYGLQADLATNQAACMSAILYERQIEFAYEGKRFLDMRRWMLFDGGEGISAIEGAPTSWKLTGWGGNTCNWLGVKPFNGQRRENIEFRTADKYGVGDATASSDPLRKANVARCAALDLRTDLAGQMTTLKNWYKNNLTYKLKKGDAYNSDKVPLHTKFFAKYYFFGLTQGALNNNSKIEQTIGWEDSNKGNSNGTFDPLAE